MKRPSNASPRIQAVLARGYELLRVAKDFGALQVALCGSAARGDDHDRSDLDFYVHEFVEPDATNARRRANQLVDAFRRMLAPYSVYVRGIPGWPLDPEYEASMKTDTIDLHRFLDMPRRGVSPTRGACIDSEASE
jgi:predicted nucleotidyltransferase